MDHQTMVAFAGLGILILGNLIHNAMEFAKLKGEFRIIKQLVLDHLKHHEEAKK